MQFPELINRLKEHSSQSKPLYLVGGAVRDSLLSKPCSDFDFVCHSDSERIARNFANENGGVFFVLDGERNTYRVLINTLSSSMAVFDFAAMRGVDIQEDLSLRDFTINAMAVDLLEPEVVIDPFKGGRDLQQKWLRTVSQSIFMDDPLRTIRAIRYAVALGLKIEPSTTGLITAAVQDLAKVSVERKRDELFRILSGKRVHASVQLLERFDIFKFIPLRIAPEFPTIVTRARALEDAIDWLCAEKNREKQAAFYQASLLAEMGQFKDYFKAHFLTKNNAGRDRKSLLQLASIIEPDEGLEESLRAIALSVDEIREIGNIKTYSTAMSNLLQNDAPPTAIQVYHFFKAARSAGIDLVVIALADYSAKTGSEFSQDEWLRILGFCGSLVEAWFTKPESIDPTPLLNGDALIREYNLEQGPMIGVLLDELKEEQVRGSIKTVNDASRWIVNKLRD